LLLQWRRGALLVVELKSRDPDRRLHLHDRTALAKALPPDLEQQLPSVGELTAGLQRIVGERAGELAEALDEDESRGDG